MRVIRFEILVLRFYDVVVMVVLWWFVEDGSVSLKLTCAEMRRMLRLLGVDALVRDKPP